MPNKNYLRGVRLEREVIEIFKKAGYIAMRTAGSHSPYDVVLIKENKQIKKICFVAFVQCKTSIGQNKHPLEMQELELLDKSSQQE